ncbi:unnamed protein product [Calypogeia fissa]
MVTLVPKIFMAFFADDVRLIIRASLPQILYAKEIFEIYGKAFGLFMKWHGTKAVFISVNPLPTEFLALGWAWESSRSTTKLLGLFVNSAIDAACMETQIKSMLNDRLARARLNPHSLIARVSVINQLILGGLWYSLALWTGSSSLLKKVQRGIMNFLWAGQAATTKRKVNYTTVEHQVDALACKHFLWALFAGRHPLQLLLRERIKDRSWRRWGTLDFA